MDQMSRDDKSFISDAPSSLILGTQYLLYPLDSIERSYGLMLLRDYVHA